MTASPTILITIVAYFALLISVGFVFKRFVGDGADYFRSGSRATWWMVGTSIFMSGFSAWTFTGAAAMAFEHGWSVIGIYMMPPFALLIQALMFARRFRQLRATTVPELIRARYNPATQQFYAVLTAGQYILLGGVQLYALAIFMAAFFGVPVQETTLVLGVVIGIYIILGGSWAALGADNLQAVLVMGVVGLVAWLALGEVGGIAGLVPAIDAEGLTHAFRFLKEPGEVASGNFTLMWLVAMATLYLFEGASFGNAVKYFSVKDGRNAAYAAFFAMGLALIGAGIWFLPAIVGRLEFADQIMASPLDRPAEGAFAVVALTLLPGELAGLLAVAVMAATVSSMDTTINRNSAILVRDIFPVLSRWIPLVGSGSELFRGRVVSFGLCLAVVTTAVSYGAFKDVGVFDLLQRILAMVALPMTIPLALGMLIRRTPSWSAAAACLAGLSVSLAALVTEWAGGQPWTFAQSVFWTTAVGVGVYLGTLAFAGGTSAQYRRRVNVFFSRMGLPVDFENEVGASNDHLQMRAMAILFLMAGVFLAALSLIVPWGLAAGGFFGLVGIFLVLGAVLMVLSRKLERNSRASSHPPSAASVGSDGKDL